MSGVDERKFPKIPRCLKCGASQDIVLKYNDDRVAGWIVSEKDIKAYGFTVIIADTFCSGYKVVKAGCETCTFLDANIIDRAIVFFNNKVQTGNYMKWEDFSEALRLERKR